MECHKCPESASCPNGGPPLFGTAFTTEIQITGVSSSMILDPANVELHDIIVAAYATAAGARNPNDYESSQPPSPVVKILSRISNLCTCQTIILQQNRH